MEDNKMNEKVAEQIRQMKEQTFGVEVEMTNITRENAAKLASQYFGTGNYKYTARQNGYDTWSAWDTENREWKFQKDVSIQASMNYQTEMVTPILLYKDMETLQELIRIFRKVGAKSYGSLSCGIHIHIGKTGHTPQTLRNLVNIMASHESLLATSLNLDNERISRYCRMVDNRFLEKLNKQKPKTMEDLMELWYGTLSNGPRNFHYNISRYHMLNFHSTFTIGTIEFRLFQFDEPERNRKNGLHAGQLKSYIQLCLALSQIAKQVKTASPKEQQKENPKYAMRTWLLRLGFVGEEFKTARYMLTKRLPGDSRYR